LTATEHVKQKKDAAEDEDRANNRSEYEAARPLRMGAHRAQSLRSASSTGTSRSAPLMIGPLDGCFFDQHRDRIQTLVDAGRSVGYW
jgi:hypothetical protein